MASSDSAFDRLESYLRRILGLLSVLVDLHLDVAVQEASYERRRLIGGLIFLGVGIGLLSIAGLLLQGVAIFFAHSRGLNWMAAIATVATGDALLGILLLVAGKARLKGPVMIQTQARLARSMSMLRTRD